MTVRVVRKHSGKVRFRIPGWSMADPDRGSWRTMDAPAGESVYRLSFDLRPRIRELVVKRAKTDGIAGKDDQDWETKMWTGYGSDKDMERFMRKSSGVEILRGPLVLAKADVVGTPEPELISEKSIYGSDPKLRLEPISAPGVWGAWNLIIGEENPRCIPVCDFISAGDEFKSLGMRFNLWF